MCGLMLPCFSSPAPGLWLFGIMEIAFIDVFGYLVNVLTQVTGEAVDTGGLGMKAVDWGSPPGLLLIVGGDDVLAQARVALPVMLGIVATALGFWSATTA